MSESQTKSILCFLTEDKGRDVEMLLPTIYFAEKFLDCKVEFAFAWEVYKVYTHRPDVVLLPNTVGNFLYFEISKYAYEQGIKVFAMISEGNFRTDGSFNYWGCNREVGMFYQDYLCLWSKRALDFLLTELPQFKDQIVLTGAPGFDRYKMYNFSSREDYLKSKNLPDFKKVVGYAAWGFGKLGNEIGRKELLFFFRNDESRLKWAEEQMYKVEGILRELVESNPDTLFIFKKHPKQTHEHLTKDADNEISRLKDYPNVLYIAENEDIHDIISVCDVWMGFESTTAMEAWMMDESKPTLFITPDPEFNRTEIYKGCINVNSYQALQAYLNEFYSSGTIQDFETEERKNQRKRLIHESVGFSDGFNHIRTAYYLKKTIDRPQNREQKAIFSFKYFKMYYLLHLGKYFYLRPLFKKLPKFKKTLWLFDRWRLQNIDVLQRKYQPFMEAFYRKHRIHEKLANDTLFSELVETKHSPQLNP